jgi:EPS-associated MarR family transcriptional regulator
MNRDEIHLELLRRIEKNPQYTQRALSREMGVSLGKVNYCVKKLIEKGWVKANNFRFSPNKLNYKYLLTPKGIENKSKLTVSFLHRKIKEYELLKAEIIELKIDSEKNNLP